MKTTARDIMSTDVQVLREDSTVEDALKILFNNRITGLPVVDKRGKLIGVYSEYDVLKQVGAVQGLTPELFRQAICFTGKMTGIEETTSLNKIMRLLKKTKYRRLPVVSDQGKLVGIITRRDLMKVFYYRAKLSKAAGLKP